jgi:tyrosine-protein kinase Etk/Wzc
MSGPTIGVSSILIRLSRYRKVLAIGPLAIGLIVGIYSSFLPSIYTAYARLLPPQTNTATASTLLNAIGGTAILGAASLNLKNPSDLYASLFFSRTVQDEVIEKFSLAKHYDISDKDKLRMAVSKRTKAEVGKDGIITLSYTDIDSQSSADIANGMIDAMYRIAQRLARGEASRRLDFYDNLIEDGKKNFARSIENLLKVENETGLSMIKEQESLSVSAIVELKGMIASREVELTRMAMTATEYHPEVVRLKSELQALRSQLHAIDFPKNRNKKTASDKKLLLSFQTYSELRAKVEPMRREVDIVGKVLDELIKARTLSRVDDSRDLSVISILDDAVAPTDRSGPRIYFNAVFGFLIGGVLTAMSVLVWDVLFSDQARRDRWSAAFRALSRKRKSS